MRKIEQEMITAIKERKSYRKDNTVVNVNLNNDIVRVYLHNSLIAEITDGTLYISNCGYQTKTTKSRLNSILLSYNLPTLCSKKFEWYLKNDLWLGSKTFKIPSTI